jgi:hypothetical protein
MDIDLAIKNAVEATSRMRAMVIDYSKSGKELKSKIKKEYEEALKRLDDLISNK